MQNETYQQEFIDFQNQTTFSDSLLPEWFNDKKELAMEFHAPSQLKMSADAFEAMYKKLSSYSLAEMGTLLSIMESKSAKNLEMDMIDYMKYQKELNILAAEWKKLIDPEVTRLNRKIAAMNKIAVPGGGKVMPLGKA